MKRILSSSCAAVLVFLSPGLPFYQALALPGETHGRTESISNDQFIQNMVSWRTVLSASPNILESFGLSRFDRIDNFIAVAARIPGFEPRSDMTPLNIQDGMRTHVRSLARIASQIADPANPLDYGKLSRLTVDLEQARPF